MPSGLVYLLRVGDLHKIGITRNVAFRMNAIGTELKMPVWLLHCWPTHTPRALERYLHKMFSKCRVAREWFRLGYPEVERLRHLRLDAAALPPAPVKTQVKSRAIIPRPHYVHEGPGITFTDLFAGYGFHSMKAISNAVTLPNGKKLSSAHLSNIWHGRDRLGANLGRTIAQAVGIPLTDLLMAIPEPPLGRVGRPPTA